MQPNVFGMQGVHEVPCFYKLNFSIMKKVKNQRCHSKRQERKRDFTGSPSFESIGKPEHGFRQMCIHLSHSGSARMLTSINNKEHGR